MQISEKLRTSREDLDSSKKSNTVSSVPFGTLGVNRELWGAGVDKSERERFDALLEKVLAELEPIALQEQMFCINFFQMDVISPTSKNTQTTLEVLEKSTDSNVVNSPLLSPNSSMAEGTVFKKFVRKYFIITFTSRFSTKEN